MSPCRRLPGLVVLLGVILDYDRDGWLRTDGSTLRRRARADGSFASANDPRVLVGLGESAGVSLVRVTWPSRRVEEWADLEVDGYITLTEGRGRPR